MREFKFDWTTKLYKCTCCWEFLPRENYSKNILWYDFISSECKSCYNKRMKEYRLKNKDKIKEAQKAYREKRRMMMNSQLWNSNVVPIPEPQYPQPWPQPIPEPQYPQPWPQPIPEPIEIQQDSDDELIIQSAIEKYPDAYTEILWDEDTLYYFNEKRSTDKKIEELQRRQEKFDKMRAEKEYNITKEKMRDLVDETLPEPERIRFADKLHSLHEEQQDDFVRKVSKLSKVSFPVSREAIFDALLDKQTGKDNNKETTVFTL